MLIALQDAVARYDATVDAGVSIATELVIWGSLAFVVYATIHIARRVQTIYRGRVIGAGVVSVLAVVGALLSTHYVSPETQLERAVRADVAKNFEHSTIDVQDMVFNEGRERTATVDITSRNEQFTALVELVYVPELGTMAPVSRESLEVQEVKIASGSPLRYLEQHNAFPNDHD